MTHLDLLVGYIVRAATTACPLFSLHAEHRDSTRCRVLGGLLGGRASRLDAMQGTGRTSCDEFSGGLSASEIDGGWLAHLRHRTIHKVQGQF